MPSLTVPPQPQAARIFFASCSFSGNPLPVKPTVTVFPPRLPVSRLMSTRPRFFSGSDTFFVVTGPPVAGWAAEGSPALLSAPVSYTHLRAHETGRNLVCRLLLEK